MPTFKTLELAKEHGIKNYFNPKYKETRYGNWEVKDLFDEVRKDLED